MSLRSIKSVIHSWRDQDEPFGPFYNHFPCSCTRTQTLSCGIVASKEDFSSPELPSYLHKKAQNVVTCTGCKVVISTLDAILNHKDQLFPSKVAARLTNAGKSSKQILEKLNVEHELKSNPTNWPRKRISGK